MDNNDLSSHEKKELKQEQRDKERLDKENFEKNKQLKSKIIKYSVLSVIILLIVFGLYKVINNIQSYDPYYEGLFHWHANFKVNICGNDVPIRCNSNLCGIMLTHHHNDNIIHTEGNVINQRSDVSLGAFFDRISIPFSSSQILDKKNNDLCPDGHAGKVKLLINGVENDEFRDYVPSRCNAQLTAEIHDKCDKIEVRFE